MSNEKKIELMAKAELEALQKKQDEAPEPEVVEADEPEAEPLKAKRTPKKK